LETFLEDEQKVIKFFYDYKMYGMIFNGISFSSIINETAYQRKITLPDFFDNSIIEENGKASVLNRGKEKHFLITGKTAETQKKENTRTPVLYQGKFIYSGSILAEGILDTENDTHKIKYEILWTG
jgi:hypothetical protein